MLKDEALHKETSNRPLLELIPNPDALWQDTRANVEIHQNKTVTIWHTQLVLRESSAQVGASVAVVVPTYNVEDLVLETLNSILQQSHTPPVHIVLVDDGSIDSTLERVLSFMQAHTNSVKMSAMSIPHIGNPGVSRNLAMAHLIKPDTKYIAFMDGDDLYASHDSISQLASTLESNPELIAAYGDYDWIDEQSDQIAGPSGLYKSKNGQYKWKTDQELTWQNLAQGTIGVFHLQCLMVRRSIAGYLPYRPVGEDEEYYAMLFAQCSTQHGGNLSLIVQVPAIIANYRKRSTSLTEGQRNVRYVEPEPTVMRRYDHTGQEVPLFYDIAQIPDQFVNKANIGKWLAMRYSRLIMRKLRREGLKSALKQMLAGMQDSRTSVLNIIKLGASHLIERFRSPTS